MSKHKYEHKDTHHRKPKSHNGNNDPSNLAHVPKHYHRAWHQLFQNFHPYRIAEIINSVWIDPSYELIVRRRDDTNSDMRTMSYDEARQ